MSPLPMCAISCANTASTSSRVILFSKPVDTATSELFLVAPVANALGSGEWYTATSGIWIFHWRAWFSTVFSSHASTSVLGEVITSAPTDALAMLLESSSEIIEPVNPTTAAYAKTLPVSCARFRPVMCRIILITTSTAILVAKKRKMRFMCAPLFGLLE